MADAKRKAAIIWWRRSIIGAAAAAIIVFSLVFTTKTSQKAQIFEVEDSQCDDLVAVLEKENSSSSSDITSPESILMADAIVQSTVRTAYRPSSVTEINTWKKEHKAEEAETYVAPKTDAVQTNTYKEESPTSYDAIEWDENDTKSRKDFKTSIVLSGVTGTSTSHNKTAVGLMKRPSMIKGPAKTGITETSTNTAYGIPVSVGAGVKIDFNEKWSLGIGANYSLLTRKFYGTYTNADNGDDIKSTSSDIKNSQHYVGIPVNAYYNILNNKRVNLYTYAGGCVEKCVSDKYEVGSTGIIHSEKAEGVQLSANVGIGVEFMIGEHLGIYVDPSVRYYFDNDQPKSLRTDQPFLFGAEMGLRIKL